LKSGADGPSQQVFQQALAMSSAGKDTSLLALIPGVVLQQIHEGHLSAVGSKICSPSNATEVVFRYQIDPLITCQNLKTDRNRLNFQTSASGRPELGESFVRLQNGPQGPKAVYRETEYSTFTA
jgi:hypothetical protein